MKIRKGFVTNSSSSSFILGFKSEESIKEELQKENLEEEYFEEILRDVTEAAKLDREDVLEGYSEEIYYQILWEIEDSLYVPYSKKLEIRKMEEFQEKLNKAITDRMSELEEDMQRYSVFVEINYSDNDGLMYSTLEHHVVPDMNCCLVAISHH